MKIVLFYHSLISDWNHGNAHFLRGVATELLKLGHDVKVYEPENGWSYTNWLQVNGQKGLDEFKKNFPSLETNFYNEQSNFYDILKDASLVIVHEWNETDLIKKIGTLKIRCNYKLLFHDTHHRAITAPREMGRYDLSCYDGVLAYGKVLKDIYLKNNWTKRAWTWHEAADTNFFHPLNNHKKEGDIVWVGNWGDEERTEELKEFLIDPVKELRLNAKMYGVRYPGYAVTLLKDADIEYGGYLPSAKVPEVFSKYKITLHVPRRPYVEVLKGIPTIRPFEAMACGIPLISSPWEDCENLFEEGKDFLMVNDGKEMKAAILDLLSHPKKAALLAEHGLKTILVKHTCAIRVQELLNIYESLQKNKEPG